MLQAAIGDTISEVAVTVEPDVLTDVVVVAGAGNLLIRAEASAGGTRLNDALFYRIYDTNTDLSGNRREVARSGMPEPLITLPAGDYVVRVEHGETAREVEATVSGGELTDLVVALNVAYLRVQAIPTEGADALNDTLFYRVYDQRTDLQGNRREVARSGAAQPLFRLPEGDYTVEVKHGEAIATEDVSIQMDTLSETVIDMNLGYVKVASVLADGLPAIETGLFYRVFEQQTDLQGNRKEVGVAGAALPLFRLTAGDYLLSSAHGASVVQREITVDAGTLQEITVVHDAGVLRPIAVTQEGGQALNTGVFWRLLTGETDLSGNRAEVTVSGNAQPSIVLPAGGYILRATLNGENYDFEVALNPGEVKDVTVLLAR